MYRKAGIWLLAIMFLLPALSCSRLPEKPGGGVALSSDKLPAPDCIPMEWGKFVNVTTNPAYSGWFQLWFEDEAGTIRMLPFNLTTGQLDPTAVVFPRK